MASKRASKQKGEAADHPAVSVLRHVLVVGGTTAEWDALSPELWASRRLDLAKVVAHAGAMWLTIRPYAAGPGAGESHTQRVVDVREGCTVIVDPSPDGRARLLAAIDQLRDVAPEAVDEAAIAAVLMAPAPVEPDLTVVLGTSQQLPSSLIWELAYSEIVYVDSHWNELSAAHVEHAIDEYSRRHRRFGGIET
ncbi:MAG: hypothetical protein JWN62_2167 [Acidimicrobiales bacterium]|nr:hypothetical protein [Acidimicrobiales bacterium]